MNADEAIEALRQQKLQHMKDCRRSEEEWAYQKYQYHLERIKQTQIRDDFEGMLKDTFRDLGIVFLHTADYRGGNLITWHLQVGHGYAPHWRRKIYCTMQYNIRAATWKVKETAQCEVDGPKISLTTCYTWGEMVRTVREVQTWQLIRGGVAA